MRVLRRTLLVIAAAMGLQSTTAAGEPRAEPADAEISAFIDAYVKREVTRRGIPGAGLVVVRDGRPILSRGYGLADLTTKAPIDPDRSLFRQGSISKLFGWVLAMQLVEAGQVDLDRDVNAYLDFQVPKRFGKRITMRHLMTHTAGFSDRLPLVGKGAYRLPVGRRLQENMPEITYAPGTTLAYSNYGAALGAYVVERVAGRPFEQLVAERIFAPAGMTGATFAQPLPAAPAKWLVSNYSASARRPSRFEYIGFAPAGSLSATPADMGRFVAAILDGGAGAKRGLLPPRGLAAMTRLQRPLVEGLPAGIGLGFIVGEHRGVRYAGHGGSMMAAATDLEILPDHGLGWTISFNGRGLNGAAIPLRQELLRAVIDRFYAQRAAPAIRAELSTAREVAGSYVPARRMHSGPLQLASIATLKVREAADGELRIQVEDADTRWIPVGRDRFVEARTGLPLAVSRDASRRVARLASPLLNSVTEYERAPLHLRYAMPVLLVAPAMLLLGGLAIAGTAIYRRLRRRRSAGADIAPGTGKTLRRLAGPSLAAVIVVMLAWLAYLTVAIVFPAASDQVEWALPWLQLLGLVACAAAAVLFVAAVAGWRDRQRGILAKAGMLTLAMAAISFGWLLLVFGFARLPLSA